MSYTLKDLIIDGVKGNDIDIVQIETYNNRKSICEQCNYYKLKTCTKCGCIIDFKAKLKKSTCPIGKW